MILKFLFCCSNSTLKENKTITFEEKDNNILNGTMPPYVNMNKHRKKKKAKAKIGLLIIIKTTSIMF